MTIVAPGSKLERVIEAVNELERRFSSGTIELGPGTSSVLEDARIGPSSTISLSPKSVGADMSTLRIVNAIGQAVIEHEASQEGQSFGYLVYTGE